MKRLITATVVLVSCLASALTAAAEGPQRVSSPFPMEFTYSGACDFDILIQPTAINNEYTLSFVNENGVLVKQITTGALIETLTNAETGQSITVNVSGPGIFTYNSDGSMTIVLVGPDFAVLGIGNSSAIGSGRTVINVSASGQATIVSQVGSYQSVCPLLS